MTKYAVLIAIEEYSDADIDDVDFARRDAEALSESLALHGFDKANQVILIDSQATKGVIESKVRKIINRLQGDDILFFYYAGHGFSKGAKNFLTCHDTLDADWDGTSIAVAPIFDEMQASDCERFVLFLDCCESGVKATPGLRGVYGNLKEHELEAFLDSAKHCVCFAACRSDEKSYPSRHHRHGVWTYHVIEAFRGDAPTALEHGILTAFSLQNYLKREVPRTLRHESSSPLQQTPWMYGALSGDFKLADLRPILQDRCEKANKGATFVTEISFKVADAQGLTSLSGWQKHYRIPDRHSDTTNSFAAGCAEADVKADLDSTFDKLKQAFGFVRRDLDVSHDGGAGTIITPFFNYSVSVELNPDDLTELLWERTVHAIKVPGQITSEAFAEVFDDVFDTLEFALPTWMKIEDFIDAVEDANIPDLEIDYDRDATYCKLRLDGTPGTVTLRPNSLSVVHDRPKETQQLLQSFDTVRKLIKKHNVPLIAFTAPKNHFPPRE